MRLKGILITAVVLFGAAFAVANWQALFVTQNVNLFFTSIELPLGLVLLFAAVGLSLVFFLVSLFDRAVQLRQITQQENTIVQLRQRLDRRRLEELAELSESLRGSISQMAQQIRDENSRLEVSLREDVSAFETRMRDRMDELDDELRRRSLPVPDSPEVQGDENGDTADYRP